MNWESYELIAVHDQRPDMTILSVESPVEIVSCENRWTPHVVTLVTINNK